MLKYPVPRGATLGLGYRIPVGPDKEELERMLTLRQRQSGYSAVAQEPVVCAVERDGWLEVPRFWGVGRWGPPEDQSGLSDGLPMESDGFAGTLRDEPRRPQVAARDACLASFAGTGLGGGMLVLPCGYGKTVVAIAVAAAHRRRTIVVVGKQFLMDQWTEQIRLFVPGARIGFIRQDRVEVEGCDFVLAMLQSLSKRAYPPEVLAGFGLAIFDEAHHVAARCFNRAVRALPARCVLGLSATPDRKDGLGPLLEWSLGPELFRAVRPPEELLVMILRYTAGAEKIHLGRDKKPMIARMQTDLAADPRRNLVLAREIAAMYAMGRHVIVVSERLEQLHQLRLLLLGMGVDPDQIGDYVGKTKTADRVISAGRDIVLSTYSMAREALDIQRLDTLVMASPVGGVEQVIGRIQRPGTDKQTPLVLDLCDPFGPFYGMAACRANYYRKQGFETTEAQTAGLHHGTGLAAAWAHGQN
jgi:superfamily II DNA or RNA helicase